MYVIFDLDGCLSDDEHRLHLRPAGQVPRQPEDYDEYNRLFWKDHAINHATFEKAIETYTPIFITARPEKFREGTFKWITKNLGLGESNMWMLLMRPDGDMRTSPTLKVDMLKKYGIFPGNIAMAFDDREDVCRAYFDYGIKLVYLMNKFVRTMIVQNNERPFPYNGGNTEVPKEKPFHFDGSKIKVTADKFNLEGFNNVVNPKPRSADQILEEMAATFRERNKIYGNNYRVVGEMLKLMCPDGVPSELVTQPHFHLIELLLVKLTRFGRSGLTHKDSMHDIGVYAALIEAAMEEIEHD